MYVGTYEAIAASDDGDGGRVPAWLRAAGWLVPLAVLGVAIVALRSTFMTLWSSKAPGAPRAYVSPAERVRPAGPPLIAAAPVGPKASVRVGQPLDFAVVAGGGDLRFGWSVDGAPAGMGPRWTYVPDATAVGRHRIDVGVADRRGTAVQSWAVRVQPARPPRIMTAQPMRDVIEVERGEPVKLSVATEAATPDEELRTRWTIDGAPVGEGASIALRPPRAGMLTVRALVTSDLGGTASHDWQLHVLEPPPPPPPVQEAALAPPPPALPARIRPAPAPTQSARATPAPGAPADDDVRRWLARYAAAWSAHDVEALRRMGQVSTDDEVDALRRYFERVSDLDVELDLIALEVHGERTIVRFIRRDRFHDPAGRLVEKESPPIEKQLVRTSDGLRLVHAAPAS
jgi:hypothetical protein